MWLEFGYMKTVQLQISKNCFLIRDLTSAISFEGDSIATKKTIRGISESVLQFEGAV